MVLFVNFRFLITVIYQLIKPSICNYVVFLMTKQKNNIFQLRKKQLN